jgi:hypothetical protein
LNGLKDSTRIEKELSAVLEVFDNNLDQVLTDLMQNRLRFNTFLRLFFSRLVVEVDRPGIGWRKGKKKGELPDCNARIKKFALAPQFAEFVNRSGLSLPQPLKAAEGHENLCSSQGSPWAAVSRGSDWEFLKSFEVCLEEMRGIPTEENMYCMRRGPHTTSG